MNVGFEMIVPTPQFPAGVTVALLAGRTWDDHSAVVVTFKTALKVDLRRAQGGRCSFCRRLLPDDYATHIEHFIEKAVYAQFTFTIQNLSLSCGTCNGRKNGSNRSLTAALQKRAKRQGKALRQRCRVLSAEIPAGQPLPVTSGSYRWVHPHVDRYSDHVEIERGWVFRSKTRKGKRTIRAADLNALALIEQRALSERLQSRGGRLSLAVGALAELSQHRARKVAAAVAAVAAELRRRRV